MKIGRWFLASWLAAAVPAAATWSMVAADTETQEVAVASATCVTGFDLRALSPAVAVGIGGGAAQSLVDSTGIRRQTMFDGLFAGLDSDQIMAQLIALSGSDFHQNGVADTAGHAATFSGTTTLAHSSGVTGSFGTVHYAIQGNVLTGSPVITMAEQALVDTAGDLPEKLMAAMEAARAMGGDGRCSCSPSDPTGCGSPPPSFAKSADIGFMILARYGDADDPACTAGGCADGDYYLNQNVAFQDSGDPDPVLQLRDLFDAWRLTLEDRPDAVRSTVAFEPRAGGYLLRLELFDWRGIALDTSVQEVTVEHHPESDGTTLVGSVSDLGDGTYEVPLTATSASGVDIFLITIDDGIRPVVIPPLRTVLNASVVFADGFESGDTSVWSVTVD